MSILILICRLLPFRGSSPPFTSSPPTLRSRGRMAMNRRSVILDPVCEEVQVVVHEQPKATHEQPKPKRSVRIRHSVAPPVPVPGSLCQKVLSEEELNRGPWYRPGAVELPVTTCQPRPVAVSAIAARAR